MPRHSHPCILGQNDRHRSTLPCSTRPAADRLCPARPRLCQATQQLGSGPLFDSDHDGVAVHRRAARGRAPSEASSSASNVAARGRAGCPHWAGSSAIRCRRCQSVARCPQRAHVGIVRERSSRVSTAWGEREQPTCPFALFGEDPRVMANSPVAGRCSRANACSSPSIRSTISASRLRQAAMADPTWALGGGFPQLEVEAPDGGAR